MFVGFRFIFLKIGPGYYDPKYLDDKDKSFNHQAPSFLSSASRNSHSIFTSRQVNVFLLN